MYADYDDNEIGALETEEIEGHVPESSNILMQYAAEFERDQKKVHLDNEKIANKSLKQLEQDSDEGEEDMKYVDVVEKEKWDCETILSTYSNIYNHPKLIVEPPVTY